MTALINENLSTTQLAFIGGGTAMTAWGIWDATSGNDNLGAPKMFLGMAAANLGTIGLSEAVSNEILKSSVVCGAVLPILRGTKNFCSGIYHQSFNQTRDGVLQLILGISSLNLLTSFTSHSVSVISGAVPAAALSGYTALKGIQEVAAGKIQKGIQKTAWGLGGIALSGLFAFKALSPLILNT